MPPYHAAATRTSISTAQKSKLPMKTMTSSVSKAAPQIRK